MLKPNVILSFDVEVDNGFSSPASSNMWEFACVAFDVETGKNVKGFSYFMKCRDGIKADASTTAWMVKEDIYKFYLRCVHTRYDLFPVEIIAEEMKKQKFDEKYIEEYRNFYENFHLYNIDDKYSIVSKFDWDNEGKYGPENDHKWSARSPSYVMTQFALWLKDLSETYDYIFMARPSCFDWMYFKTYYDLYAPREFLHLVGFNCIDLSSELRKYELLAGISNDPKAKNELWDSLKEKTIFTHRAYDDAIQQGTIYLNLLKLNKTQKIVNIE